MNRKKLIFFWLFVWSICWLSAAQADYYYFLEAKEIFYENGEIKEGVEIKEGNSSTFPTASANVHCTLAMVQDDITRKYIGGKAKYSFDPPPYSSSALANLSYTPSQSCTAHVTFNYVVEVIGLVEQAEIMVTGKDFLWQVTTPTSGSFDQYISIDAEHRLDFVLRAAGCTLDGNLYDGSAWINTLSIEFVPLPATFWLVLSGLAGAACFKRRRTID